jgi:hypothetical protein
VSEENRMVMWEEEWERERDSGYIGYILPNTGMACEI